MEGEIKSGKPLTESVMVVGMEGAAVMEGETKSGKPLAEGAVADCMEGAVVVDMEGEPHQVNH
jgi:hypothetical protein